MLMSRLLFPTSLLSKHTAAYGVFTRSTAPYPWPQVPILAAGTCHLPPCSESGLGPVGLVSSDCVLGVQVAEHQLQAWEAAQQAEEEEEEVRRAEQLSDALLQQEAKTMAEEGYRPKVGTRQVTGHRGPILGSPVPPLCLSSHWL